MGRNSETIKYHRMLDAGEAPTTKPCSGCGAWLPLSEFGASTGRKDGLNGRCKPCARAKFIEWTRANKERHRAVTKAWVQKQGPAYRQDSHRAARYGMKRGEFAAMVEAQSGACAICSTVPSNRLVVDHDHASNRVRALLCDRCNHALHLIEQPELLAAALAYLEAHRDDDLRDTRVVGAPM